MEPTNRVQGERWRPFLAWLRRYRPYVTATLAVLVLLAILVLLGYCVPDWPRQIAVSRATYYEEGQVLVAGLERDIEAVIAAARQDDELEGISLELITPTLELDFFQRLPLDCALRSRVVAPDDRYLISLFKVEGKVPEPKVVEVIQRRTESLGVDVSPELNYRTGRPPVPLKGDPWSVGGGPWSVGGGPWSVGGGAMGDELVETANKAFHEQWALNRQGMNVNSITPEDPEAGRGVRVGVFDTLPLPVNVSSIVVSMDPPLTLNLVHYMVGGRLDPESDDPDIDDHGLFAAGLVHSVAPGSEIQLIRVLDDTAQGNVWILNAALNDFIDQVTRDRDELEGAVINLSLGIHPKPGADESNLPEKVRSLQTILESKENDRHYLVMEYVPGGSLRDLLDMEAQLSTKRALEISLDLADALTRAHRLGIIHRDLKPSNVLLAEDSTPRLTDFGIAYVASSQRLTTTGTIVGTISYLSPEACKGEMPDARADIWAFGVMPYEMLAGEPPFAGTTFPAVLMAILTQPVPDLHHARPDAPDALVSLIDRMLKKDRQERIPSVRLVGAGLEAILADGRLQTEALATSGTEGWQAARQHPLVVTQLRDTHIVPRLSVECKGEREVPATTVVLPYC